MVPRWEGTPPHLASPQKPHPLTKSRRTKDQPTRTKDRKMEQPLLLDELVDGVDHEHMASPTPVLDQVKPGETYEAPEQDLSDLWGDAAEMELRAKAMEQHGLENEKLGQIEDAMKGFVLDKTGTDLRPYLMNGSGASDLLSKSMGVDPQLLKTPEIVGMFEDVVKEELQSREIAMRAKEAEEMAKDDEDVIVISDDDGYESPRRPLSSIKAPIAKKKRCSHVMGVGTLLKAIKKHGIIELGTVVRVQSFDKVAKCYKLSWETQPGSGNFDEVIPGNLEWSKDKGKWMVM